MNMRDIFKKSFLEGFSGADIIICTAAIALFIASVIALYIYIVYRVLTLR